MNEVLQSAYQTYSPAPFTSKDRKNVTILFGGLTWRAERALEGVFHNSGYRARSLPQATRGDLLKGRELADIGQCCPTAFTTGNLMRFLEKEAGRIGRDAVADEYIFVTSGACGSCRFGQYHQSYELALSNIGLDQFRLFLVQQNEIDQQRGEDHGLETNTHMLLGAVTAIALADIVQDFEYRLRPYEIEKGATNRAAKLAMEDIYEALASRPAKDGMAASIWWHLTTSHFDKALQKARRHFESVRIDRLRLRPMVKITGEFYLATVEGEQNYNIHRWLEEEGAEVYPAAVSVNLEYLMRFARQKHEERGGIKDKARLNSRILRLAERLFDRRYNSWRAAFGGVARPLPDQSEIRAFANPYFDNRITGGDGDLLLGKAIWTHVNKKAHMICELSPYGCLPNTMSVGAMANVLGDYPDLLYAPLEIKGDSEVHALSRCQMILSEAKSRAAEEMNRALQIANLTIEEAREKARQHPKINSPFWHVPQNGAVSTAANAVLELGGVTL